MDNMQTAGVSVQDKPQIKTYVTIVAFLASLIVLTVGAAFLIANLPKNMGSAMDRGDRYLAEKDYVMAIAAYREALQQNPNNIKAYEGIVDAYQRQGDDDAALHMLEKGYEKTGDESLEERAEALRESIGPVITGGSGTGNAPDENLGQGETARQRQVALLEKAYELLSKQDYDGMCSVDGSDEADLVIEELKGDHVIYIPEEGSHGTGVGCGVYQVNTGYFFYYGDYVDGERNGHGVSYWYNGSGYETYDGEWKDDAPNGYGTSALVNSYGNATYRTGNFVDGLEDGDFTIRTEDTYSHNVIRSGEYYVNYGRPVEATDELEQIYNEVEADLAAGNKVDYYKEILHDEYDYNQTYGDETIYVIYDDYQYESYYRYADLLGALGYR